MIKWFTALLFSIAIHILIFLSYVFFATESEVSTSRKITNVNFFDEELQEKGEMIIESDWTSGSVAKNPTVRRWMRERV